MLRPGCRGERRVDDARRRRVRPRAPGFALALQVLAGRKRTPSSSIAWRPTAIGRVTSAPDESAFIEHGIVERTARERSTSPASSRIKELGALTARAKLFVGVDSMPMHLAAAMGTPTVALFGPSGENEWGPERRAPRGYDHAYLPPVRLRRLRRRQGLRVPHVSAGRGGARGGARAARGEGSDRAPALQPVRRRRAHRGARAAGAGARGRRGDADFTRRQRAGARAGCCGSIPSTSATCGATGLRPRGAQSLEPRGFDLVQSHERIPGCDVYRAGDGVHRRWLELRRAAGAARARSALRSIPTTATCAGPRSACSSIRGCAP